MGSMVHGSPASRFELEHLEFLHWSRQYQLHHEMRLPDIRPWHRLIERHDANPARFDLWHPHIGRWIEQQESIPIPTSIPPLSGPRPYLIGDERMGWTSQPVPPIGEPAGHSAVPEPSSLIPLSVAMLATWLLLPLMRRLNGVSRGQREGRCSSF
jgi:hypothetical protein